MTRLWGHQQRAVSAAVDALAHGGRAAIVAACGTGKTLIGETVAARLAGRGRVLVVVPTLDLLWQTMETYRAGSPACTLIAVCSADEASSVTADTITTRPSVLAALLRADMPTRVLCTYASLPVIAAGHANHGLQRWDLLVVDEAHRTAGAQGKAWSAIHHDTLIPARRRLYLTATPRIYSPDGETGRTLLSMDDTSIYGKVVFRLGFGEAIQAGLLADYRVVVPVVTDTQMHALLLGADDLATQDPAQLGVQVATLRAAREYNLQKILSYHHRVAGARAFSAGLPAAQTLLGAPDLLWSHWVAGSLPTAERRRRLAEFAEQRDGVAVLANARLLNEGVDIPAVDAVVFGDKKDSLIDTVQAAGRALRTGGNRDKIATIVVPVFVGPDESPEAALEASAYAPLWKALAALRAHDDRLNEWLGHYAPHPREPQAETAGRNLSWIHVLGIDVPDDFALAITVRTVGVKSAEWRAGYAAARRWHRTHGSLDPRQSDVDDTGFRIGAWVAFERWLHSRGSLRPERVAALEQLGIVWTPRHDSWDRGLAVAAELFAAHGDLAVPVQEVLHGFRIGTWLRNQRTRPDLLTDHRRQKLADLDPMWDLPFTLAWHRGLREARLYRAQHGNLDMVRTYTAPSGHNLGEWVHKQRRIAADLDPRQRALLDELGMDWETSSPHERTWRRHLTAAQEFHAAFGHLEVPQTYVTDEGVRLGTWINNCRRRKLSPERLAELDRIGMRWLPSGGTTAPSVAFRAPE
ncbi:DEAD/DEAH box helicase [Micromonospora aurantiaca (nom. illeg.)]|uniref:DEAD/DEAH box helicase n=1 Tax=Micromonospora aurantiaca (nom. illeg.) TaxID=47850 RepID=UPI0033E1CEEA